MNMGAVDLVIQVEAPHTVSPCGTVEDRAGHHVGEVCMGWFLPARAAEICWRRCPDRRTHAQRRDRSAEDSEEPAGCARPADRRRLCDGDSRPGAVVRHHVLLLRALPRSAFEAVLDLLAGKYPSDRFADLRPRIIRVRDAGTITGRPGAQQAGGHLRQHRPGTADSSASIWSATARRRPPRRVSWIKEMVTEFTLRRRLRARSHHSRGRRDHLRPGSGLPPAFGQPASLPFWRGDGIGRPAELGEALSAFARRLHEGDAEAVDSRLQGLEMDTWARQNLLRYLDEQHQAVGTIPSDTALVVERTKDELGDGESPALALRHGRPRALGAGRR